MKKLILCFILLIFSLVWSPNPSQGFGKMDYERIYKDMPVLDFMYETRVDPEESRDYEEYAISPYVLVRLPVTLRNKKILLPRGYYLVKPEKKDGFQFVIFKQNGIVKGAVPVYKAYITNPLEVFPQPPQKPKTKWYFKPFVMVGKVIIWPIKKLFERKQPKIPPRAKTEFEYIQQENFYIMGLYVENRLYKMLFKLGN